MSDTRDKKESAAPERRALRFNAPADVLADAERIAAAERAGRLRRTGNWTAGQNFGHIAAWIDYGFDGYPISVPPEISARARAAKDRVCSSGMMPGVRMSGVEGGTAGIEDLATDVGLERLRRAWARLEEATPTRPHVFFGDLTRDEWLAINLRHAELHLGFLHP